MKVGDLVYEAATGRYGIVERVDKDYHGARQAFKVTRTIERGKCIRPDMVDYTPILTEKGIRDRVMVCWTDGTPEYLESHELEVINESR